MTVNMTWQPWVDYKEEAPLLNISAPPCVHCKFWKPQRRYMYVPHVGNIYDGVQLCTAEQMEHDFGCYKPVGDGSGGGK